MMNSFVSSAPPGSDCMHSVSLCGSAEWKSGGRIRTYNLQIMSLTRKPFSHPRREESSCAIEARHATGPPRDPGEVVYGLNIHGTTYMARTRMGSAP